MLRYSRIEFVEGVDRMRLSVAHIGNSKLGYAIEIG